MFKKNFNLLKLMETRNYISNKDLQIYTTEDLNHFINLKNTLSDKKIIATHSGAFHADEVLACYLTKFITNYKNCWIIRSRNNEILKLADIVCDVGGIFNPEQARYDHHMKEFVEVFDEDKKIKMSSAGLIYKFHGKEIIKNLLTEWNKWNSNSQHIDVIFKSIYNNFICYVDANDNGINQYQDDHKPIYANTTGYAQRISRLNPEWNDENPDQSYRFKLALDVAEDEFYSQLSQIVNSYLPSLDIVKDSIINRKNFHESGKILYLSKCCPWKEHLFKLEEELNLKGEIQFVLYGSGAEGYRVQTVPLSQGNFKFRKGLKENWRGTKLDDLIKESGIDDIVFVHSSGFIGGAKSIESALNMAIISLNE